MRSFEDIDRDMRHEGLPHLTEVELSVIKYMLYFKEDSYGGLLCWYSFLYCVLGGLAVRAVARQRLRELILTRSHMLLFAESPPAQKSKRT